MAAAYIKVFCNGICVRVYGGNTNAVREMRDQYKNMTVSEFVAHHPKFYGKCKHKQDIVVEFKKNS